MEINKKLISFFFFLIADSMLKGKDAICLSAFHAGLPNH